MAYSAASKAAIGAVRACYEREGLALIRAKRPHGDHELSADAPLVLVACSGGRDSLALAWAAQRVGRMVGVRVGAVTVDHQLQEGSAEVAATATRRCAALGCDPAVVTTIDIPSSSRRRVGTEAAARQERYRALAQQAKRMHASAVLLAHTCDDQAEGVVLGLLRGSSSHALAAMGERSVIDGVVFCRPFLGLSREDTTDICRTNGLQWWDDPTNGDALVGGAAAEGDLAAALAGLPLRSQVRQGLIPRIKALGGAAALRHIARIGEDIRADDEYCAEQSDIAYRQALVSIPSDCSTGCLSDRQGNCPRDCRKDYEDCLLALDRRKLVDQPPAIRRRVLRRAIGEALELAGAGLARPQIERQVAQLDTLVCSSRGGGKIAVSAYVYIRRFGNVIELCLNKRHASR